jgi:hypothetical protein
MSLGSSFQRTDIFRGTYFRFLIKDIVKTSQPLPEYQVTSYHWHRMGFYTIWTSDKTLVVLCFGIPDDLESSLSNLIELHRDDPFSFHTKIIEGIVKLFDSTLWTWRNFVRDLEKVRPRVKFYQKPSSTNPKLCNFYKPIIHYISRTDSRGK